MKSLRFSRQVFVCVALMAGLPVAGRAALIAYEGFNYDLADGTSISNENGGTGWGGAWVGGLPFTNTGLSGTAVSVGGAVQAGGGTTVAMRRLLNLAPVDGDQVWFSALIKVTSGVNDVRFGLFHDNTTNVGADSDGGAGFIVRMGSSPGIRAMATVRTYSSTNALGDSNLPASGTTYTVLGRISFAAGNDAVEIWLNPADTSSVAALGTAHSSIVSVNINTAETHRHLLIRSASVANTLDEIRIGSSLADVSPIPEPSSAGALFGLGAAGFALSRRRRERVTS